MHKIHQAIKTDRIIPFYVCAIQTLKDQGFINENDKFN